MLPGAAAHVFVADLGAPALDADDTHHLARVLRLRPGEEVTACDGKGGWRACRFAPRGGLVVDGPIHRVERALPAVVVAFAPPKGERPEWIVQKLTEVGVDRIVPLRASRSVVRWEGDRAIRQCDRLRRVARAAAMQSRRVWLPVVEDLSTLAELRRTDEVVLAHPGGGPLRLGPVVAVGPEGGWDEVELAGPPKTVSLAATVLRAETAAVVAGALLTALRGGIVTATTNVPSGTSEHEE